MLSDHLTASVVLCDSSFHILNLVAWPRGLEDIIKDGIESLRDYPASEDSAVCPFLPDCCLSRLTVNADPQRMELFLVKEGDPLSHTLLEQSLEGCAWG